MREELHAVLHSDVGGIRKADAPTGSVYASIISPDSITLLGVPVVGVHAVDVDEEFPVVAAPRKIPDASSVGAGAILKYAESLAADGVVEIGDVVADVAPFQDMTQEELQLPLMGMATMLGRKYITCDGYSRPTILHLQCNRLLHTFGSRLVTKRLPILIISL